MLPTLSIAESKRLRTSHGLEFKLAWVQGHVVSIGQEGSNTDLTISDGSGPTLTVCLRPDVGLTLPEPGQYVLLVGRLGRRIPAARGQEDEAAGKKRRKEWQLAAQKIKLLGGAVRRAELWQQEVLMLHETIYPTLVQRGLTPTQ
ncbi:hypothetical protein HYH02_005266 [Chlamydomonas schloesseri]|uniref:Uncharacterized protein n=1 Tax=Chlamydomonas schloesseri TaxID=2026947 RepID=A0A835WLM9_9CHLO|nr:hypothetical protein HYH02_005266 [Chlamydomonas schloesseri]|eukprot:KAG2449740.1 hypothetical protein HYH02_005266 [Chlamydomonas schloesseri]